MILAIDNFDMVGPRDYTAMLDATRPPKVVRKLNEPARMEAWLVQTGAHMRVPLTGARVVLERRDGTRLFTGYLETTPEQECLGEGERGPVFRYRLLAIGEAYLLDRRPVRERAPFVHRFAGEMVSQMAQELAPAMFDTSGVQAVERVAYYASDPRRKWSAHAAELAQRTRSYFRVHDGRIEFAPVASAMHSLNEGEANFSANELKVQPLPRLLNDISVIGRLEPQTYVKDYFLGDGYQLRFSLGDVPFTRRAYTVVEDEYAGSALRPEYWKADAGDAISVGGGKLRVAGGRGDGVTTVCFAEQVELGGAYVIHHGDFTFTAPSDGMLGGFYDGEVAKANCVAGFEARKSGAQTALQALINGAPAGPVITTVAGHRYSLASGSMRARFTGVDRHSTRLLTRRVPESAPRISRPTFAW